MNNPGAVIGSMAFDLSTSQGWRLPFWKLGFPSGAPGQAVDRNLCPGIREICVSNMKRSLHAEPCEKVGRTRRNCELRGEIDQALHGGRGMGREKQQEILDRPPRNVDGEPGDFSAGGGFVG